MTGAHWALLVIGLIGLAESSWGLTSPAQLKETVTRIAAETPERNPFMGIVFVGIAALCWALMSPDKSASDWALLLLSWLFTGGAYVNFRRRGFQDLTGLLITHRSHGAIRLLYAVEFGIAATLITLALLQY